MLRISFGPALVKFASRSPAPPSLEVNVKSTFGAPALVPKIWLGVNVIVSVAVRRAGGDPLVPTVMPGLIDAEIVIGLVIVPDAVTVTLDGVSSLRSIRWSEFGSVIARLAVPVNVVAGNVSVASMSGNFSVAAAAETEALSARSMWPPGARNAVSEPPG